MKHGTGNRIKSTAPRVLRKRRHRVRKSNYKVLKYLKYLDVLHNNQYEKNKSLLASHKSVFKAAHNKVSFATVIIGLKQSGIKPHSGLKYLEARLNVLKSLNASLGKLDMVKAKRKALLLRHEMLLLKKQNLRYFLRKNFLPCNGQRTKTNARTCKKKRTQGLGLETKE